MPSNSSRPIRILHLEDSPRDADLIGHKLEVGGVRCEIVVADSEASFTAALARESFDVVLCDYNLPDYDGISALKWAKQVRPGAPVIIISGSVGEEEVVKCLQTGATDYLLKQRLERLVPAVNRAIHEAEERRSREQLEDQLRQAQKMESVGQLAGGIAHDFNNLLTVINGMAELVLAEISGDDQPQIHSDLQEIRRAGERAAALTRQLLAFSRKQILQPQVIDVSAVVADIGTMLRRLLGEDVDLVITAQDVRSRIKADRGQIEQVLANLVVNARDAMPQGGTLSIEISTITVDEQYARAHGTTVASGPYVTLAVRDSGSGMDETTRRQIFEPFFTTKGVGKGTGLGLSTVYGIVKQSAGFIWVESEVGRGSCFTIYLPQVGEEAASPSAGASSGPARGTETILVVEDVVGLCRLMRRTLEAAGYTVLTAAGGDEALRLLERHGQPVHLMVTDVVMPGMSGRSLAEHLAQLRPEMKVLYMSGYTDDVILRHGVVEEGTAFISKPFGSADLIRKVRQTLDDSS